MNLLFTNAGRRTYLIEYALQLAEENGYDLTIFAGDVSKNTAAFSVSDKVIQLFTPYVTGNEVNYLDTLEDLCKEHKIDVIIPLMDFELPVLSENKARFLKTGTRIWVSDFEVIDQCLDKKKNYQWCLAHGIRVPKSWWSAEEADSIIQLPVIKKAILGSGSVGLEIIRDFAALKNVDFDTFFLQAFVEGREVGMDIFNDYEGNFLSAHFREKMAMRAGETDKARSFNNEALYEKAKGLSAEFRHTGNMDIDFMESKTGEIYFIDFNPRFGGGYPFTHHSGLNYLKAIIDLSMGNKAELTSSPREIIGMKGIKLYFYER
ncbi:MAG: carbamoyl-phosphate synthase large subunit [Roseivirga sp.]|jgi:carbamoyl-phosphate synthase large subunit